MLLGVSPLLIKRVNNERTLAVDIYRERGCETRADWLGLVADETGLTFRAVVAIADVLGPAEDFDGLVTSAEDAARTRSL